MEEDEIFEMSKKKNDDNRTFLHTLASNRQARVFIKFQGILQSLVNEPDDEGWYPLHISCTLGDFAFVKALIESKCDLNCITKQKRTPLMYAASKGYNEIVYFLIDEGAKLDIKDRYGSQAIHRACSAGHLKVVEYLLDKNKNQLEYTDSEKNTPLLVSLMSGHNQIALYLVSLGADVKVKNIHNQTVADFANPGLIDIILKAKEGQLSREQILAGETDTQD